MVQTHKPRRDKTNKVTVRPVKTQISHGIRPVWSESSPGAQWVAKDPMFLHTDSEDSDQTGRMPRLIWVFAGRTLILLVLSCRGHPVTPRWREKRTESNGYKTNKGTRSIWTERENHEIMWKEILWKYSIQTLKTADSVLLSLFLRDNGRCDNAKQDWNNHENKVLGET